MLMVSSEFLVPPGFRFQPTKQEIFSFYLRPAIKGELLPANVLMESDIYGENREPWKLFNKEPNHPHWVFTKLKKKSKSRIDRTAGCGCWLGRSIAEVRDAEGELLGFDKYFTFSCKKGKKDCSEGSSRGENGNWVMHEFSLNEEGLKEYAICEIRNKDSKESEVAEVEAQIKKTSKKQIKKRKTASLDDEEEETMWVPATKQVCLESGNGCNNICSSSLTTNNPDPLNVDSRQVLDHQESHQTHNPIWEIGCYLQSPQEEFAFAATGYPNTDEEMDQLLAMFQVDDSEDIDDILAMIDNDFGQVLDHQQSQTHNPVSEICCSSSLNTDYPDPNLDSWQVLDHEDDVNFVEAVTTSVDMPQSLSLESPAESPAEFDEFCSWLATFTEDDASSYIGNLLDHCSY